MRAIHFRRRDPSAQRWELWFRRGAYLRISLLVPRYGKRTLRRRLRSVVISRSPQVEQQQERAYGNRRIRGVKRGELIRPEEELQEVGDRAAKHPVPHIAQRTAEHEREAGSQDQRI